MTEQIDPMALYVYEPEGSLWAREPVHTAGVTPEEWDAATKTLLELGQFATGGALRGDGQPLDVALTDAWERARMQARRAREEGWREPKDGEIGPGQQERIVRLIERCDHFSNAVDAVREAARVEPDRVYAENYLTGKLLPFIEAEEEAAKVELRRYKREIGLLED